jgi:hypothetical protein
MEEVVNRTGVVNCLQRIGQIIAEMPESTERAAILDVWLDQAETILRPDLEQAGIIISVSPS